MTGNPISIFDVALRHTRTVEVCIDRLQQLGANHELNLLSGRLQRLQSRRRQRRKRKTRRGAPKLIRGERMPGSENG
jgi:hypothetical protein